MNLSIKQIRKDKGISQEELADKIGITQAYLSQIENNKRHPMFPVIYKICDILEIENRGDFFQSEINRKLNNVVEFIDQVIKEIKDEKENGFNEFSEENIFHGLYRVKDFITGLKRN